MMDRNNEMSRTELRIRVAKKTSNHMKEICFEAMKKEPWREVSKMLSSPSKNHSALNLFQIDKETTAGDTIVIVGKVLSKG